MIKLKTNNGIELLLVGYSGDKTVFNELLKDSLITGSNYKILGTYSKDKGIDFDVEDKKRK